MDGNAVLAARISDLSEITEKSGRACFTGFLNSSEQASAIAALKSIKHKTFDFWGGYENAERRMLGLYPYASAINTDDFPLYTVFMSFNKAFSLCHRDFLGALMAEGVKREFIGDIIVTEGLAAVYIKKEIREYLINNIKKVGSCGISFCQKDSYMPPEREFKELTVTVSSLRADTLVAALAGLSREKTSALVTSGNVLINNTECKSCNKQIKPGDIITIRHRGKYIVTDNAAATKKGKIRLIIKQY